MANPFDQFDQAPAQAPAQASGNPFDQFDQQAQAPVVNKLGAAAFPDFLKQELQNTDWGTRNIAGFGTALSNIYEGAKQFIGQADPQQIQANQIIEKSAPVGSIMGNAALTAIPFGMAGNTVGAAGKVGAIIGALQPVQGDQTAQNITKGKLINTFLGGATAMGGQALANKVGDVVNQKLSDLATQRAQNAPLTQTVNDALDAGLVVPPSAVNPTIGNTAKEMVSGKSALQQIASNRNSDVVDAIVRQEVGLAPNEPLTSEAMRAIRQRAYQSGYAPIAQLGEMDVSPEYKQALDALTQKYVDASQSFPGVASPDVQALVNSFKPPTDRFSPATIRDQGLQNLQDLIAAKTGSRTSALQEVGKLQTEAAQAMTRANNYVPVPGMPRVPARLSNNLDLAQAYQAAVPDAANALSSRTSELSALNQLAQKASSAALPDSSFDPQHALIATQVLRDQASEAFRQGNNQIAKTKLGIANEIENEIERQLGSMGQDGSQLLGNFRQARTLMAKAHDIEDAIVEGGGTIDPRVLGRKLQAGSPLSGGLRTIGAFANNFPKAMQPAKQVGSPAVSALRAAMATPTAVVGTLAGGPTAGLALGAAQVAAPYAMRSYLLSQGSQNALRDIYQLGLPTRMANSLLQYAPVGSTVLGLNALGQ